MIKIVILEAHNANPGDLSWDGLSELGKVIVHADTKQAHLIEKAKDADVIITNKLKITEEVLAQLPKLRLIQQLATGTDNIDLKAAEEHSVIVKNAIGYSTDSVAQHVFALILALSNHVVPHNQAIQQGDWTKSGSWCHVVKTPIELANKTIGLVGFGKVGQQTAMIALGYGMKVLAVSRHSDPSQFPKVDFVDLDHLMSNCDILSIHSALTEEKKGLVDRDFLGKMKKSAFLINTARGGHINESNLRDALLNGIIAGAGLDVLSQEPPPENHPLIGLENCIITSHMAWSSFEARKILLDIAIGNVKEFFKK